MKRILTYLIFLIFLSSSFDIFFNINIGGFNIRTCYLASMVFAFLYFLAYKDSFRFKFIGFIFLVVWFIFPVAFVFHTQFLNRNIGYIFWMIFNFITCYSIFKFSNLVSTDKLIKYYLISFLVIAFVGFMQFFLSLFGLHVLITMWWRENIIPRINGLSYEPSYFATYLMMGFVFLYYCWRRNIYFFNKRFQTMMLITLVMAIFLSTSRMGILVMLAIILYDFFKMLIVSFFTLKISRLNLLISVSLLVTIFGVIFYIANDSLLRHQYLAGTGLEATAGHSTENRLKQMTDVYKVFEISPVYGYSLGGIAPAIARYYGSNTSDAKKVKEFEGLNIFLEVLAASGIFGFVFFASWLFLFYRSCFNLSKILKYNDFYRESIILEALIFALSVEFLLLLFSQNILRPYLWIIIGMLNALYFKFKSQLNFKFKSSILQNQ